MGVLEIARLEIFRRRRVALARVIQRAIFNGSDVPFAAGQASTIAIRFQNGYLSYFGTAGSMNAPGWASHVQRFI